MPSAGAVAAARRHLDEGVGPALARGAGQLVDPRRAAQALLGLRTVGLEEVAFEAVQFIRTIEPETGSRVIWPSHMPPRARLEEHVARGLALLVGGLGPVGVGQLLPVLEHPGEVLEAQFGGLGHEHRPRHGPWRPRCGAAGPTRWPGRVAPDATLTPGLGHLGQMAQGAPQAHPALGGGPGHPTTTGDPRGRRLGPVGRPLLARLEGRRGLGHERIEARLEVVQLLHRCAVAVVGRTRCDQCLECCFEVLQLHMPMQARGCDKRPRQKLASKFPLFPKEPPSFRRAGRPFFGGPPSKVVAVQDTGQGLINQRRV